MESKKCSKCKIIKKLDEFCKDKNSSTGTQSSCKICTRAGCRASYVKHKEANLKKKKQWVDKNKEYHKKLNQKWHSDNKEYHNTLNKEWYKKHKDHSLKLSNNWWKSHPAERQEKVARYRANKLKATPSWLTIEQRKQIQEIYKSCQVMCEFHEEKFHVDHIEPLKGKTSCGLHVPWNLQILTASENSKKRNKLLDADS